MQTAVHKKHIQMRTSYNTCSECRADTERRFVLIYSSPSPWRYAHISEYLAYIRPRLHTIHAGDNSPDARNWMRKFQQALDRRITAKVAVSAGTSTRVGRKYCDSYLDRLRQFTGKTKVNADAAYLRRFAMREASCLDG